MTSGEWYREYEQFRTGASERKLRLFSCACCRRVWHSLKSDTDREFLEAAERIIDGVGLGHDYVRVLQMEEAWHNPPTAAGRFLGCLFHARLSRTPVQVQWYVGWWLHHEDQQHDGPAEAAERSVQVGLLREIFGNPLRPLECNPAWRTSDVMALATSVYESRDFTPMPILADALQDAGCDSDDILNHLRDPHATHVRGCWALDLVLGKE
jgi:hypothetical protein